MDMCRQVCYAEPLRLKNSKVAETVAMSSVAFLRYCDNGTLQDRLTDVWHCVWCYRATVLSALKLALADLKVFGRSMHAIWLQDKLYQP